MLLSFLVNMSMFTDSNTSFTKNELKVINLTRTEVEKIKSVNWNKYSTRFIETDSKFVKYFHSKETPKGYRGSLSDTPNFTVEVQKHE